MGFFAPLPEKKVTIHRLSWEFPIEYFYFYFKYYVLIFSLFYFFMYDPTEMTLSDVKHKQNLRVVITILIARADNALVQRGDHIMMF